MTAKLYCELPGCDVVIEQPAQGGNPRRYCTAEHRAEGRRVRVEAAGADSGQPTRQLRRGPARSELASQKQARSGQQATAAAKAVLRRRRAIAVLGAVGILASGGGLVATSQSAPGGSPGPEGGRSAPAPQALNGEPWAAQAQVTLTSVEQQLDQIAQAEAAWKSTALSRRAGSPPATVTALLDQKAALEQLRTRLRSELAAWRSLHTVRDALAQTQQQLAELDKTIHALPAATPGSAADQTSATRLAEHRDMLIRQRDLQRQELTGWEQGVAQAVAAPLPEVVAATTEAIEPVLALTEPTPPSHPAHQSGEPNSPALAARMPHEDTGHGRQDFSVGAPPRPERPTLLRAEDAEVVAAPVELVNDSQPVPLSAPVGQRVTQVEADRFMDWLDATVVQRGLAPELATAAATLASVEDQLDRIATAEAAWTATAGSRRVDGLPTVVAALSEHKATLEQLRNRLRSELSAWQSLHTVREALALTEQQLAELETTIRRQRDGRPSPSARMDTVRLTEQRDLLVRQRDVQRRELTGWEQSVVALASSTPRPVVAEKTRSASERGPARTAPAAKANGGGGREVNVVTARQPAPPRQRGGAGNQAAAPVRLVSGTASGGGGGGQSMDQASMVGFGAASGAAQPQHPTPTLVKQSPTDPPYPRLKKKLEELRKKRLGPEPRPAVKRESWADVNKRDYGGIPAKPAPTWADVNKRDYGGAPATSAPTRPISGPQP